MPDDSANFLPAGGNYQELLSYKKSEVIYDFTFRFYEKFLKRGDRTIDQMVQASRSGKQNIAEGSKASITSTEMASSSPMSPGPVWRSSYSTIRTTSGSEITHSGRRTPKKPSTSGSLGKPKMSPISPIRPILSSHLAKGHLQCPPRTVKRIPP